MVESGSLAYGLRYLSSPDAIALNPEHLPLRRAPFEFPRTALARRRTLPLSLRDALPDAWDGMVLEADAAAA